MRYKMNFIKITRKDGKYWKYSIVKESRCICWKKEYGSGLVDYQRKDGSIVQHRRNISTITTQINPFPRWYGQLKWKIEYYLMFIQKRLYRRCEGCGEGIAKYRIRDPNAGQGNRRFNCCKNCVDFYDRRWSAMDIIGWEPDGEPINTYIYILVGIILMI